MNVIGETHAELVAQIVQAPVVGGIAGGVGDVVVLEGDLAVDAVDQPQHTRDRVHPGFGFG
jgi:hypothetical protein